MRKGTTLATIATLCTVAGLFALTGCGEKTTGEKMDDAMDNAADQADDAQDAAQDAADDATKALEQK